MTRMVIILVLCTIVLFVVISLIAKSTKKLNTELFKKKWNEINILSADQATWVQALIEADKLLDEALKQSGYTGRTTADRMVAANRAFSNADATWRAHKLRNKVVHEMNFKLNKKQFFDALKGFKQTLRDLGAL